MHVRAELAVELTYRPRLLFELIPRPVIAWIINTRRIEQILVIKKTHRRKTNWQTEQWPLPCGMAVITKCIQ
ncbi:hypothetical protein ES703_112178 [subsurface metagenome]